MAGFGRFKLTDALPPEQQAQAQGATAGYEETSRSALTGRSGKGKGKGKRKGGSGAAGKAAAGTLDAEQVREARESAQARNAEASSRDRMVDIGRGNQQAGRQRAK